SGPGATCLEAFARRRPIVFFEPIAGHGVDNARFLEQCGLARFPRSEDEFVDELRARRGHSSSLELARAARLFAARPCADILLQLRPARFRRPRTLRKTLAVATAFAALLSLTGSGVSAEMRVLRRPAVTPGGSRPDVALCIRVGRALNRAGVAVDELRASGAHATFFVSGTSASARPDLVHQMVHSGDEIG